MFEQLGTTPRLRLICLAVVGFLIATLSGCGDSGSTSGSQLAEMSTNRVIHNDAPEVQRKGSLEEFDGYLSESSSVLRAPSDGGSASVRFDLGTRETGFYELFAWWPQTGGNGARAVVRVDHADGQTVSTIDQSVLGGQWNSLGVFELGKSPSAITFEQTAGAPMLVDAVRVFRVGIERPALELPVDQLSVGELDEEYRDQITARGGRVPYSFQVLDQDKLPPGLVVDRSGMINGRAAQTGSFKFRVEVRDGSSSSAVAELAIDIVESSQPSAAANVLARKSVGDDLALSQGELNIPLLTIIEAMPEGSWKQVNQNEYSEVWAPAELRPLYKAGNPPPSKIIGAWSSFGWDSNRGNLLLYGGGHANYRGNEVYLWRGATQRWERASLPSESRQDVLGNWNAIDGADRAPASAHTYDNTVFLPLLDRLLVLGGAADANGGQYLRANDSLSASRITGPYLFDPNKTHPDRVGGTTGSHVQRVAPHPEIVGGEMWTNRENWLNPSRPLNKTTFTDGCTAYAEEDGTDVVYMYAKTNRLYRYRINDLSRPDLDTWEIVGRYWGGPGSKTTCGYDPVGKSFVRTGTNTVPFVFWDLNVSGEKNNDVRLTPSDLDGGFTTLMSSGAVDIRDCALDFDPKRRVYSLWCGGGSVWLLESPPSLSAAGWTIRKAVEPQGAVPNGALGTGILGKWKYARDLDVFIALQDSVAGNVWVYKPVGWQKPGGGGGVPVNLPPDVSLVAPLAGSDFAVGTTISLNASASDTDGYVTQVEFLRDGSSLGVVAGFPYVFDWAGAPSGTHVLTAVATDNVGARRTSAAVTITVRSDTGGGGTSSEVILQRDLNDYVLVADTYLSNFHPSLALGASTLLQDQNVRYTSLIRFAIFQSEGGPVPNGATIESATLSLYKYSAYNMTYTLHRLLKPWLESQATWLHTGLSESWSVAGANGADIDYESAPAASASISFASGQWIEFDLAENVQRLANGAPNLGWRLRPASGYVSGLKRFYTSDYVSDARFRPKLTIRYR